MSDADRVALVTKIARAFCDERNGWDNDPSDNDRRLALVAVREFESRSEERITEAERLAKRLRLNFAEYLAPLYLKEPSIIAELCDEQLDQSGALLGYVRDAANVLYHRASGEAK